MMVSKGEVRFSRLKIALLLSGVSFFIGLQILFPLLHWGFGPEKILLPIILSPAARVEGTGISYRYVVTLARNLQLLNSQLSSAAALNEALTLAIQQRRIAIIIDELGVASTQSLAVDDLSLQSYRAAGWSEAAIERFVQGPHGLLLAASAAVLAAPSLQEPTNSVRNSLLDKIKGGMPFSDVAARFSDDSSAATGGDLGYFNEQETPDWMRAVFSAPPSEVVLAESVSALWILQREDSFTGEGGVLYTRLRGIAILKRTLSDVLAQRAAANPAKIYVW